MRTLTSQLKIPLTPGTSAYGETFEYFIILQCKNLTSYYHRDYRLSYLKTKDEAEIDLVVERPGLPLLLIEIRSTTQVQITQLTTLKQLATDLGNCEAVCFSNDPYPKILDGIKVLPWREGIQTYFAFD